MGVIVLKFAVVIIISHVIISLGVANVQQVILALHVQIVSFISSTLL